MDEDGGSERGEAVTAERQTVHFFTCKQKNVTCSAQTEVLRSLALKFPFEGSWDEMKTFTLQATLSSQFFLESK